MSDVRKVVQKWRVKRRIILSVVATLLLSAVGVLGMWLGMSPSGLSSVLEGAMWSSRTGKKCAGVLDDPRLNWTGPICITDKVYLDINADKEGLGRLTVGLFGDIVPLSTQNFLSFVNCDFGKERCLRNDSFHRLIRNFVIQGGSSSTANSFINNSTFSEEESPTHHSFLSHGRRGLLAWAEYPIGSQFYITLCCEKHGPAYLDGNHVVFGTLLGNASEDTLYKMAAVETDGEKPKRNVKIVDAGVLATD